MKKALEVFSISGLFLQLLQIMIGRFDAGYISKIKIIFHFLMNYSKYL